VTKNLHSTDVKETNRECISRLQLTVAALTHVRRTLERRLAMYEADPKAVRARDAAVVARYRANIDAAVVARDRANIDAAVVARDRANIKS